MSCMPSTDTVSDRGTLPYFVDKYRRIKKTYTMYVYVGTVHEHNYVPGVSDHEHMPFASDLTRT